MSQLHAMRLRIEEKIKADGLDADDAEAIAKLKKAAKEVLNLNL